MSAGPVKGGGIGHGFGRLWGAAISSNLADGIARLAVPLTAVTLTTDPLAISLLAALSYVPWLVFGVPAGVIVDRVDRRVAMAIGNAGRMVAAVGVALAIATGHVSVPILAAATLLFGFGETVVDNATTAVVPSLVGRERLDKANGRIQAAQTGIDMFVATPVSGVLFALAMVLPMIVGALGYVVAAVLALSLPVAAAHARPADESGVRAPAVPLRDAMRFLWHHAYLRPMVLLTSLIGAFIAFAQAVTVLVFVDHFGVGPGAIGLVTAGIGVGGVLGSLTAPSVVAALGRGRTLLGGMMLAGLGLAAVALAPSAWVAVAVYGAAAYGVACWNVVWGSMCQALIPGGILGRATGAMRTASWGLMPVATLVGGWVAREHLMWPYAIGGLATAALAVVGGRLLLAADARLAESSPSPSTEVAEDGVAVPA
ncbi:MFS transporter [Demequina pelophila]|uniref:MFS transporter n=1 Tax=Demequina pelophila TaxID=1638984 RepID=UPI000785E878|nr:MFS transporter [Demequina pelophila]